MTSVILKLLEDKGCRRAYCGANKEIGGLLEIPRLNLACAIGYEGAVKTLLEEANVDTNAKDARYGQTSLSWAVVMGREAVIRQLLDEERVDRNCSDSYGRTPLSLAIADNATGIVRLLLEGGVMVNSIYKEVS